MKNLNYYFLILIWITVIFLSCGKERCIKDTNKGISVTWIHENLFISFRNENMISIENTWPDLHDIEPYDCKMKINSKECTVHADIRFDSEKIHLTQTSKRQFLERRILRGWGFDCNDTIPEYQEVSLKNIHYGIVETCNAFCVLAPLSENVDLCLDIDGELNFNEVIQILENFEVNSYR